MTKQDILNLEGTLIEEEEKLMEIEDSEFVTTIESNGYSEEEYEDCITYVVTLDDGTEIEVYSYY